MPATTASPTTCALPVEELARFASRPDVVRALVTAVRKARITLSGQAGPRSISSDVDLSTLQMPVHPAVASVRVVVTRGIGGTELERHADGTQYLLAIDGSVETRVDTADGWRVDRYGEGPTAVLENRWHVVPVNTWHRSNALEDRDWSMAAFTTTDVGADEAPPVSRHEGS